MNRTELVGRITKDVEIRNTNNGTPVASFTVAVNRRKKDDGADFISCVAWNKTAELMAKYVKKGDRIGVCGRIQTRSYEKDGKAVYITEVVADEIEFLSDGKKQEQSRDEFTPVDNEVDLPF